MNSNGYGLGSSYGYEPLSRNRPGVRSNNYGLPTPSKPASMIASTGSSSIRASSQLKPVKPTNYGVLPEPPTLSIYRTPAFGGASMKSTLLQRTHEPGQPRGLTNLRNTCYINSVLQILFDMLELPVSIYSKPVTKAYCNLKDSYGYSDYKDFKREVEKKLTFMVGDDQQDAQ